jgi:hypothetical protein
MKKIMSTGEVNLFFNESENKFYSEDPKVIINALDEDCNSSCFMDALMANAVKQMIKAADGRIYKMHPDKMSVHVIRIRVSGN